MIGLYDSHKIVIYLNCENKKKWPVCNEHFMYCTIGKNIVMYSLSNLNIEVSVKHNAMRYD